MSSSKTPTTERPDQLVATPDQSQPPPPSQEAQQAAIAVVATEYVTHMRAAHSHDVSAKTLAARIEAKVRHIAEEQAALERMEKERRDDEHAARVRRDYAHAHALMLTGVGVPLPAVEVEMTPPAGAEVVQHAAVWNGGVPETGQFAVQPSDGFCVNCGQPAWRVQVSEVCPKGAVHSFGATCDPSADPQTVADLGEVTA